MMKVPKETSFASDNAVLSSANSKLCAGSMKPWKTGLFSK